MQPELTIFLLEKVGGLEVTTSYWKILMNEVFDSVGYLNFIDCEVKVALFVKVRYNIVWGEN